MQWLRIFLCIVVILLSLVVHVTLLEDEYSYGPLDLVTILPAVFAFILLSITLWQDLSSVLDWFLQALPL